MHNSDKTKHLRTALKAGDIKALTESRETERWRVKYPDGTIKDFAGYPALDGSTQVFTPPRPGVVLIECDEQDLHL